MWTLLGPIFPVSMRFLARPSASSASASSAAAGVALRRVPPHDGWRRQATTSAASGTAAAARTPRITRSSAVRQVCALLSLYLCASARASAVEHPCPSVREANHCCSMRSSRAEILPARSNNRSKIYVKKRKHRWDIDPGKRCR